MRDATPEEVASDALLEFCLGEPDIDLVDCPQEVLDWMADVNELARNLEFARTLGNTGPVVRRIGNS